MNVLELINHIEELPDKNIYNVQMLIRDYLYRHPDNTEAEAILKNYHYEFNSLSDDEQESFTWFHSSPGELVLELSGKCNLKCMMCVGVSGDAISKKTSVTFNVLSHEIKNYIDQCDANLETVYISGISEPLLAKHFDDICKYIDKYGSKVAFLTNGTLMDRNRQEFLASLGKLSVGVSFDGAQPSTFERIRHGANYDQVVGNIKGLVAALGGKNRTTSFIGLNFCAMQSNIDELPDLIKKSSDWGIDNIQVHHLMPWSKDMVPESLFFDQTRFNDVVLQAKGVAQIAGVSFSHPALFQSKDGYKCAAWKRCRHPWNVLQIQRFKVATCCSYVLEENPEAGKFSSYGSIYPGKKLDDFWNGEAMRNLRRDLLAGTPSDHCLNCTNYPYDERVTPEKLLPRNNMHSNPATQYFISLAQKRGLM